MEEVRSSSLLGSTYKEASHVPGGFVRLHELEFKLARHAEDAIKPFLNH